MYLVFYALEDRFNGTFAKKGEVFPWKCPAIRDPRFEGSHRPPHEPSVNQISLDKFQFNLLPD